MEIENTRLQTKAEMTFPRADKERLILVASLSLSPCIFINGIFEQSPGFEKTKQDELRFNIVTCDRINDTGSFVT